MFAAPAADIRAIVWAEPLLDDILRFLQAEEDFLVQTLVAKLSAAKCQPPGTLPAPQMCRH
jgi:hypothetical protein